MTAPATVADVLDKAADLIAAPGAWTQGESARDAEGHRISWRSSEATCFCGFGAVWRVIDIANPLAVAAEEILNVVAGKHFPKWQDSHGRTQEEVVAKLKEAAALAREQGK